MTIIGTLRGLAGKNSCQQGQKKPMDLQNESFDPETRNPPENNREFLMVESLNEQKYDEICTLLRGQSQMDSEAFEQAVQNLLDQGYRLTSLVAELRCPGGNGLHRI